MELIDINKLHTTQMGAERIRCNLALGEIDVVEWCRRVVSDLNDNSVQRKGKNLYVYGDDFVVTINAHSHTIITAHKQNRR
jgi:hypothetical protein